MLAGVFLLGAALLGAGLVRRVLRGALTGAEQVLWGTLVGWMLATLCVYALARWQGRLSLALMVVACAGAWAGAGAAWLGRGSGPRGAWRVGPFVRENAGLLAVLLLFAPVYVHLFWTHTLAPGEGGIYSGGSAWGDISFHAAVATSFAYGENFPPVYTPLSPEPLLYPFMPDFQAGALVSAGLSLRGALLLTAVPLALVTTGLFYQLALRLARTQGAAALATVLYMLGGGLGFTELPRDWLKSGRGFLEFWNALPYNYANDWERGIHWNNVLTDVFVPQRTSLYGLPAALVIFTLFAMVWRREEGSDEKQGAARLLFMAGVLAGVLPLFHAHTYVAVGFVSVFLFAMRPRRAWAAFWAPAVLLALPQLLALSRHVSGGGFVRLLPGWMGHEEPYLSLYLLRNFGLPLVLAVPAWLAAPRAWRAFYLPFALLFAFALLFVFSPNVFDNGKVIYHWHAVNSVLVGWWLFRLAAERRRRLLASLLALGCVASGLTALQHEGRQWTRLFSDEELAAADFARAQTAPGSLFLTAPVLNHPVPSLAGRAVVRGNGFWLWSHGYEFRAREADVKRIYAGSSDAPELLRYYGVDYVYVGAAELNEAGADASFFERHFRAAYRGGGVTIYDVRTQEGGGADVRRSSEPAPREMAGRVGRDPFELLAEFPRTSFFVHRLYKASHGRLPRMAEFMEDVRALGRGVFRGARGWEQRLEENRRAFLTGWEAREEFVRAFHEKSGEEFVGALLSNAGVEMGAGERARLAREIDSGAASRGAVLGRVVEDEGFMEREYDTAYVLVHFFGYLGRDPEAPPDRDLSGLDFWRGSLGRTGDHRALSRAFLNSEEYKKRRP